MPSAQNSSATWNPLSTAHATDHDGCRDEREQRQSQADGYRDHEQRPEQLHASRDAQQGAEARGD